MAKRVSILSCCLCALLGAQNRVGQSQAAGCNGNPPESVLARDGTIPAEYRDWDPGLCAPRSEPRPPAGAVSARSLKHKTPKSAATEFDRGVRAWTKGQNALAHAQSALPFEPSPDAHSAEPNPFVRASFIEAAEHLGEAVRLDPGFVEALADLGIVYAKLGRPEQALDQYDRALALEPNLAMLHSNKAVTLVMLGRWEEAEQTARRILQLDPKSIDGHYILGFAMLRQQKISSETEAHLAIATKKYARARPYLAAVQSALAQTDAAEPRQ